MHPQVVRRYAAALAASPPAASEAVQRRMSADEADVQAFFQVGLRWGRGMGGVTHSALVCRALAWGTGGRAL